MFRVCLKVLDLDDVKSFWAICKIEKVIKYTISCDNNKINKHSKLNEFLFLRELATSGRGQMCPYGNIRTVDVDTDADFVLDCFFYIAKQDTYSYKITGSFRSSLNARLASFHLKIMTGDFIIWKSDDF